MLYQIPFIVALQALSVAALHLVARQGPDPFVALHPNGDTTKCLEVKGNVRANGTPVIIDDCNGGPAQRWDISSGSTKVKLDGSTFCLDAGPSPTNGTKMKIWTCFNNLPAQQWFYTADFRIALENQGFCLDLTDGIKTDGNVVQVWRCTDGNTNQIWTTGALPPPVSHLLHPNGNTAKCVDVLGNIRTNGQPVQIFDCNGTGAQNWVIVRGSTKVQLAGSSFCLDAGSSPANGVPMKIWTCFNGLPAQQWFYTGDNRIALEGQGQCLDLTNGVLTNGNRLQTWQCTDFNTNQIWTE